MTTASTTARTEIRPRRTGFVHDSVSIARRAIRQLPRDIAFIGPTLFIPLFFLVINVASLSEAAAFVDLGITYEEFQLPVAIVFAVVHSGAVEGLFFMCFIRQNVRCLR